MWIFIFLMLAIPYAGVLAQPAGGREGIPAPMLEPQERDKPYTFSEEEKAVLRKGNEPNASVEDRAKAESVCERCGQCSDGQKCDIGCAVRTCGQ
jgi:hypothetical protein